MIGVILTLIQDEARRIWCHRWLGLACAAAILLAGAAFLLIMSRQYDAWAQVFVDKQTPVSEAARGVSLEGSGSASVVEKTLLNDQNLERLVRETDPAAAHMSRTDMANAVERLRERIQVKSDGEGFIEFHYLDTDPVHAARMVRRLLDQFIATNVDRSRIELVKAGDFLDEQIAAYKGLLAGSQARIDALRRGNAGLAALPTGPGAAALPPAQPVDFATEEVVVSAPPPAVKARAAKAAAAAERVATLEAKLEQLRAVDTEEHPDVVSARRQLAEAKAAQAMEGGPPPVASDDPASAAPVRRVIRRAGPHPVVPPGVAAEWADAQRNAEMLRTTYQELINKREAARMSLAVLGANSSGKFQVTRAPTVPVMPEGPPRTILFAAVVGLAMVGGLAAAWLRGALRGIMISPRELEIACQLPVIGAVSWEPAWSTQRRRERAIPRARRIPLKPPRRPAMAWLTGRKTAGEVR
jgi:uncharacterized protein involved in exopolysaccharide biosynthesis